MVEGHTDLAQTTMDASIVLQRRSRGEIASLRVDIAQTRRAIAASRELLKRFRQRKLDEAITEVEQHPSVSAFDADILRSVFRDLVLEMKAPECQWRALAQSLVYEFCHCERVEPGLVDWIISK
ncbi:hypothetical protein FJ934_02765 [Mesorhizobium sp. B2-4-12]|uniref:hypothetical protein n=1 Tax=unclassified Mesorhizobium TaxID=325217 RepID=UPI001129358F|nr:MULTISPECIES: hypothetical protein [unclassified Mesorhizobium]TPK76110.1 hypothetical protein FJ548_26605 [Mesorhizobium sp. B2-4-17]TPK98708.1 hypothetical protein FJ934_02765 [Mesorhizobium sp. B2-4-12]